MNAMQALNKVLLRMIGATFLLGMCWTEGQFVSRSKQNTHTQCIDIRKTMYIFQRCGLKWDSVLLAAVVKIDSFWQPDTEIQVTVGILCHFIQTNRCIFIDSIQRHREMAHNAMWSGFFCITETPNNACAAVWRIRVKERRRLWRSWERMNVAHCSCCRMCCF